MNRIQAQKIVERIQNIPLYLHAYAFHLNMRMEKILPEDLLDIASEQKLKGVKVHVLDGESQSLSCADDVRLQKFGEKARSLGLDIHIETSASDAETIDAAVAMRSNPALLRCAFIRVMKGIWPKCWRRSNKISNISKRIISIAV